MILFLLFQLSYLIVYIDDFKNEKSNVSSSTLLEMCNFIFHRNEEVVKFATLPSINKKRFSNEA
jgi:hypothetical protein